MKISVIMPVFNAEKYLENAIKSILNQTYTDFELIIINDKSTDSSFKIISDFKKIDTRIIIINNDSNLGPALSRNKGIDIANGEYIALMDADDISKSYRFKKQVAILEENKDIGLCGSWFTLFGDKIETQVIKHFETHEELKVNFLKDCYIGNPTVLVRKNLVLNEKFNPEFVPIEDYELWSRLINKTKFYNLQESLLDYRWHNTNISQTSNFNIKKLHKKVRLNQLSYLGISDNKSDSDFYLNAIRYSEKLDVKNVMKTIEYGLCIISKNEILNKYNVEFFNKLIHDSLQQNVKNVTNINSELIRFLFKKNLIFLIHPRPLKRIKIIIRTYLKEF